MDALFALSLTSWTELKLMLIYKTVVHFAMGFSVNKQPDSKERCANFRKSSAKLLFGAKIIRTPEMSKQKALGVDTEKRSMSLGEHKMRLFFASFVSIFVSFVSFHWSDKHTHKQTRMCFC